MRILIGLHKSYSGYKIGDRILTFFFIISVLLVIRRSANFVRTAILRRTHWTLLKHFWDHSHLYSDQCYKNALITV